jgi:hypothetical protein
MKKGGFAVLLLILSSTCFADPWSGWTKILILYPHSSGINIITEYKNTDLSSCDGGGRFLLSNNHPNYNALASALIAAFTAEKQVHLNIDGEKLTQPVCSPTINRFMVK